MRTEDPEPEKVRKPEIAGPESEEVSCGAELNTALAGIVGEIKITPGLASNGPRTLADLIRAALERF